MNLKQIFTAKNAFIIASVLLGAYLLLILTVTNIGRSKLEDARYNELQFKVDHYDTLLTNYFSRVYRQMNIAANDKSVSTYFANKSSGMSMAYGLGASLFDVNQFLKKLVKNSNHNSQLPTFSRITLLSINGSVIADSDDPDTFHLHKIDVLALKQQQHKIIVDGSHSPLMMQLSTRVYFQKKPIALLIAELNPNPIIELLHSQDYSRQGSRIELSSSDGNLVAINKLPSHLIENSKHSDLFYFEQEINNTPFLLKAWFSQINDQELLTSRVFIIIMSILAVPIFLGIYYLVHVERKNALLQSEISHAKAQQETLSIHNFQLEKEISKRKSSEKRLAYQATHDALTGLPNRSLSLQRLNHAIDTCERHHSKVLVMYIDLDNFKQINDTLGHAAGDVILQQTSKRLLSSVRKIDTVARLSGDEFMLVISELQDQKQATELAVKILSLFDMPFEVNEQAFHTSTSIGLALYPDDGEDPSTLLKSADMALYRAKDAGRNNFSFYESQMNNEVTRKVAINRRLREAIKHNLLKMYYQPLIDLKTQKIVGAEALMRWTDEELGFVSPEEFISLAEKNGLIGQLGNFALSTAAKQAAQWQKIQPLQIAINFSSVQFRDCHALLSEIQNVLLTTGLPADKLDVEVTESLLIGEEKELLDMFRRLREMGVQLSIDDFGTGYSALSYLQKFAFTKLKIDRAFIMNLGHNLSDQTLVTAIVAMAKALHLRVVAEGIEDQEQVHFLSDLECEYGQGYLFNKPLPASEFEKLLYAHNKKS